MQKKDAHYGTAKNVDLPILAKDRKGRRRLVVDLPAEVGGMETLGFLACSVSLVVASSSVSSSSSAGRCRFEPAAAATLVVAAADVEVLQGGKNALLHLGNDNK